MAIRRRPLVSALVALLIGAALSSGSAGQSAASPADTSWTVYHGDAAGSGVASGVASVNTTTPAWRSPTLDGQLFGQPVGSGTSVFVATENDTVYALNASTGAVVWSAHVGTAVPSTALPCGNISPTVGITGTPVIDEARSELFVVADVVLNGRPSHALLGLNAATGLVELNQTIDPAGSDPAALLQRTALTLDGGRVVFGFGGNYGDCGSYRGWVVSVPETGGTAEDFAVDSGAGERQGAIWMGGGAPAIDRAGDIWVSVGNGSVTDSSHPYDNSDSVLELSPTLSLLQYFAPTSWASDNAGDKDLSTEPALLSDGQVVVTGKQRTVYLLNSTHLGGIGGQQASLPSGCGDDLDGGMAVVGLMVYLPCLTGTEAVAVTASPASLHLAWRANVGGGPPVVAAGEVWTIGQNGTLYGLNPATGATEQQASVGAPANHFPTPGFAGALMLVPAADRVVTFGTTATGSTPSAPAAAAPTTTTTTSAGVRTTLPVRILAPSDGGLPAVALAGIALGALVLGTGAVLVARRRRGNST